MKRTILALTAALLLAATTVAVAPAMAQEEKDLPKSGGVPINASLLGRGAGVLLVGGGLVAVQVAQRDCTRGEQGRTGSWVRPGRG